MKEYKRFTTKGSNYYDDRKVTCAEEIYEQLKDLEDKIENGTLIEFPRIDRYVDVCYGVEKYLVQWVVNGKVKSRTFWNKKKAEKKLKELQNER